MCRIRTCICCRKTFAKDSLIRVVRTASGDVKIDLTGKAAGRGAYICKSKECLKMLKPEKFKRALRCNVRDEGIIINKLSELMSDVDTGMPMDA